MRIELRHLGTALLAGALTSPSTDGPAFRPEPGTSVSKTFTIETDFALDDFSVVVDGQDMGAVLGSLELTLQTTNTIEVTDTYVSTSGGRPTRLERTYDTLEGDASVGMSTEYGGEDQDVSSSSELEGVSVIFAWNEDEERYDVSFAEGEDHDQDLLEGLTEDMDLRVLLPPGDVSPDDTWEVELSKLTGLAVPGGNLKLLPEDMDSEDFGDVQIFENLFGQNFGEYLGELLEGSCVCTYKGVDEDTGLAEILVAVKIGSAADLTDMLAEIVEALADQAGQDVPFDIDMADFELDFEGEGVLSWNQEAGRVESFELGGDMTVTADMGISADEDGQSHTAELSLETSGSYDYTVETEE